MYTGHSAGSLAILTTITTLMLIALPAAVAGDELIVTVHTLIGPGSSFTDGISLAPDGCLYANDALGPGSLSNPQGTAVRKIAPDLTVTTFATGMAIPIGNAMDAAGNLYVANWGGVINKIAPDGTVSVFAGVTYGSGIAIDSQGNVFVSKPAHTRIKKITPAGAISNYYVGAPLDGPIGMAVDENDNLYVANFGDGNIHVIDPANPSVATFLANIPFHADGSNGQPAYHAGKLYVPGYGNARVYMVDVATGEVSVLAGTGVEGYADGPGETAQFANPNGCAISAGGDTLFITDDVDRSLRILVMENVDTAVEGPITPSPEPFSIAAAPNPFRNAATISFSLPEANRIDLQIYDIAGRLVRTLADGHARSGRHIYSWDGTADNGHAVVSGSYFYRLTGPGLSESGKLVWLK